MNSLAPYPWQETLWSQLVSQLRQDRVANTYLLCGESGLGKNEFAEAAAALLLCENYRQGAACGVCKSCILLASGSQPDLLIVEPEEGSRVLKVDQIRALASFTSKTAHSSRLKVVILRDAESLNLSAANALLKTLEEPPGNTVLLLTSSRPGVLLPTIRSRCQRINFRAPDYETASRWLTKSLPDHDAKQLLIAANGCPLKALSMARDGSMEVRTKIFSGLGAMWAGEVQPIGLVSLYREIEILQLVTQFWQASSILIKYLLTQREDLPREAGLGRLVDKLRLLTTEAKNDVLALLLTLNQQSLSASRELTGSTNPNAGLILQSLVWRWYKIALAV
ncbi:MAG: DNA polymerase III subunit delta' [Pseudohongiellaceae bacterium]